MIRRDAARIEPRVRLVRLEASCGCSFWERVPDDATSVELEITCHGQRRRAVFEIVCEESRFGDRYPVPACPGGKECNCRPAQLERDQEEEDELGDVDVFADHAILAAPHRDRYADGSLGPWKPPWTLEAWEQELHKYLSESRGGGALWLREEWEMALPEEDRKSAQAVQEAKRVQRYDARRMELFVNLHPKLVSHREKEVFSLFYYPPFPSKGEIARRLGISKDSAENALGNLRRKMRYWLAEQAPIQLDQDVKEEIAAQERLEKLAKKEKRRIRMARKRRRGWA